MTRLTMPACNARRLAELGLILALLALMFLTMGCAKTTTAAVMVANLDTAGADLVAASESAKSALVKLDQGKAGMDAAAVASVTADVKAIPPRIDGAIEGIMQGKVDTVNLEAKVAKLDNKWTGFFKVVGVAGAAVFVFWFLGNVAGTSLGLVGRLGLSLVATPLANWLIGAGIAIAPWVFGAVGVGLAVLYGLSVWRQFKTGLRGVALLWEAF